ncbi:MAG: hypothetical protein ACI9G1_003270 [Pirellulaceae bacterium]|jgi:hypothetical protein
MLIDPSVNIVVFKVDREDEAETILTEVETQIDNGIQRAWKKVQTENSLDANQIAAIYSEWSASDDDVLFLKTVFAGVEFSYRFERPGNEADWDGAFKRATDAIKGDVEEEVGPVEERDGQTPTLLPVLRNENDMMAGVGLQRSIGAGLAIVLANVSFTPRGTIGIDYLMAAEIDDSEEAIEDLFIAAFNNLAGALQIQTKEANDGDVIVVISHPLDHGASALCLPDLFEHGKSWLKTEELFVGIPDPGTLVMLPADSPEIPRLTESVISSEYWGSVALTPAVFKLTKDGLERIATRKSPED